MEAQQALEAMFLARKLDYGQMLEMYLTATDPTFNPTWMDNLHNQHLKEMTLRTSRYLNVRRPLGPPPGFQPITPEHLQYVDMVLNIESLCSDNSLCSQGIC